MTIKCVSLNIWHGGELLLPMLDFLHEQQADIYFLQEVRQSSDNSLPESFHSLKTIQSRLNYPYSHYAPAFSQTVDRATFTSGNGVITKFPIRNTSTFYVRGKFRDWPANQTDFRDLPSILQIVELETPSGIVNACNLHGVWDLDGDLYSNARKQMIDVILKAISKKQNIILAGDTNAKHTNPAMRLLENQLTSVFGSDLISTFNMRHKDNPGYATAAVDLMFVSTHIKVLSKSCPDVNVSDHLPLVVELEL